MTFSSLQQKSPTLAEEVESKQGNNGATHPWNIVSFVDVDDTLDLILTNLQNDRNSNNSLFLPPELSPYYHRDKKDPLDKPIAYPEQISTLLRQRYHARQTKQYSQVAKWDRILQTNHGVFCYDYDGVNPDAVGVWTRRRRPPQQYQELFINKNKSLRQTRKQQQQTLKESHSHPSVGDANNSSHCFFTLDSVTSRHLSNSDIQQMLQTYQKRCNDGDYESARLLQYQAKLQGIFLQEKQQPPPAP
jgi:hypothetical protein